MPTLPEMEREAYPTTHDLLPVPDLYALMEERDPPFSEQEIAESVPRPCGSCFGSGLTRYRRFICPECDGSGRQ
jgi:hypothetical protein